MATLLQPVVGGASGTASADNNRGVALALAPGAATTLVSIVAGATKLRGFIVHGETDCEAWVEVDSTALAGCRARFNRALPAYVVLPNPEQFPPLSVIALRVRNDGPVSGDFEGVLLGE